MATITPVWAVVPLPQLATWGTGVAPPKYSSGTAFRVEAPYLLVTVTWTDADGGDTLEAAPTGWLVDKSVQVSGTTVTSVAITGSNDNIEYKVLNDPQGNALTGIGAEVIEQLQENTLYIQPTVTTGTDVDITIFGRIPITG